jgi:hypothetical protein
MAIGEVVYVVMQGVGGGEKGEVERDNIGTGMFRSSGAAYDF